MRILSPLILSLFISASAQQEQEQQQQAQGAETTTVPVVTIIDCGKECADFVAAKLDAEKAASSELLASCRADVEQFQNTIAGLNDKLQILQASVKKSQNVEHELRQIHKDLEASCVRKEEAQKVLLAKAMEMAKTTQQQLMEATLEMKELTERLALQRINFKGMWEDVMATWRKVIAAVKKGSGAAVKKESEPPVPDF